MRTYLISMTKRLILLWLTVTDREGLYRVRSAKVEAWR